MFVKLVTDEGGQKGEGRIDLSDLGGADHLAGENGTCIEHPHLACPALTLTLALTLHDNERKSVWPEASTAQPPAPGGGSAFQHAA